MPTIGDIISVIETLAPPALSEDWDNSGLQIGEPGRRVDKLLVALDPLPEVVEEATKSGAGLLVTHHPLFFDAVKSLDISSGIGAAVSASITGGVAVYSAHTSLDIARPGVSDALAAVLKLKDTRPILKKENGPAGSGLGRVGILPRPMKAGDIAHRFKEELKLERARLAGDPAMTVRRVAVCGGSGSELMDEAATAGAELYVTGDIKYHWALRAVALGLMLLDVGHFESEMCALPAFAQRLRKAFKRKGWKVAVELSRVQGPPWITL